MGKPLFLLGAGASIDAGLFDTNRLTREIYKILCNDHYKVPGKVFGYVVAKILARKVRQGGSPFDEVNVEEAYDGVERLILRDRDLTSEFVSSWDPFLDALQPKFDKEKFIRSLEKSIHIDSRHSLRGQFSIMFDRRNIRDVAEEIARLETSSAFTRQANILTYLTNALLLCLRHNPKRMMYMKKLVDVICYAGGDIGSLNYDTVTEDALKSRSISYDYGLSSWSEKKIVSFVGSRADIRLMKLHGSMNWFGDGDEISVQTPEPGQKPMLVFGGGGGKLRPDGPFLQLRHEFERQLLATNAFVVIGYSFGDDHLNAIIRRWVSTRRRAKMIIVDPQPIRYAPKTLGTPFTLGKDRKLQKKTVDITHIRKKTAVAVDDIKKMIDQPIDLSVPPNLTGVLPDALIRVIV